MFCSGLSRLLLYNGESERMVINVDKESGFCPGVVSAIKKAEDQLSQTAQLYCLGDIVHNSQEVQRLQEQGLVTIEHAEMSELHHVRVLLRAHGEPPSTYALAARNDIQIIDATCPVVLQLQRKIRQMYETEGQQGAQIVIFGKNGHAEVNGLVGQTEGNAIVVESIDELSKVDFSCPVRLFSQTTMSVEHFRMLAQTIASRMQRPEDFAFFDTVCRQVANRIPHIRNFAACHDVVLFVSGKKSSNGRALFGECHEVNEHSYFISHPADVTPSMIEGASKVGICGATSTPRWQMEQVGQYVEQLASGSGD